MDGTVERCSAGRGTVESGSVGRWVDEFCDFYILKEKIYLYTIILYTLKMYRPTDPPTHI